MPLLSARLARVLFAVAEDADAAAAADDEEERLAIRRLRSTALGVAVFCVTSGLREWQWRQRMASVMFNAPHAQGHASELALAARGAELALEAVGTACRAV